MPRRRHDTKPPSTGPSEKEVLVGFLNYLRGCAAAKLDGVPEPEVRTPGVASGTNLLGLVRHLSNVERFNFLGEKVPSWPATFHAPADATVDSVLGDYRDVIARADEVIDACQDLSEPVARAPGRGSAPSMRWALTHLIEETGRHAGHLDILRELIDGDTGR